MPVTRRSLAQQQQPQQRKLPSEDKKKKVTSKRTKSENSDTNKDENHSAYVDAVDDNDDNDSDEEDDRPSFVLDGVTFKTYQDMVAAKRERNQKILLGLGLQQDRTEKKRKARPAASRKAASSTTTTTTTTAPARKSSRLSGDTTHHVALNYNVNDSVFDTSMVKLKDDVDDKEGEDDNKKNTPSYYKGRLNDGSDLTLEQAMKFNQTKLAKWTVDEMGVVQAVQHLNQELCHLDHHTTPHSSSLSTRTTTSPTSVVLGSDLQDTTTKLSWLQEKVDQLSIEDDEWVTKVTPERIYSVALHPSTSKLIACAGDKMGHVGIWDVTASTTAAASSSRNGGGDDVDQNYQHLVRPHSSVICCLEWTSTTTLVSASYDSTVRCFNAETETFTQLFGTHDDSDSFYAEDLGYGLDQGYRYWVQHVSVDPRYKENSPTTNPSLFLATSVGTALHLDLRTTGKERVTLHESLSDKKLNTLR
jgi:hypothetical protein